jgi:thiosulfate dehydrogenase [quinone] large subunit
MPKKKSNKMTVGLMAKVATRLSLGFTFLWAFFDKLIGLGFATCRDKETDAVEVLCEKAWLEGGSPTTGFLKFGTSGPFSDFYSGLAGNAFVDWLFMIGLLGIGASLTFGFAKKFGAYMGALLLFMMWTAVLPLANNPVLDDHIIYGFVLIWLAHSENTPLSMYSWYEKTPFYKYIK